MTEKWLVVANICGQEEIFAVKDTEQMAREALLTFPKGFPRMNYLYLRQVWVSPMWAERLRPTL